MPIHKEQSSSPAPYIQPLSLLVLGPGTGLGILASETQWNWVGRHCWEGVRVKRLREASFRSAMELGEPLAPDKKQGLRHTVTPQNSHFLQWKD